MDTAEQTSHKKTSLERHYERQATDAEYRRYRSQKALEWNRANRERYLANHLAMRIAKKSLALKNAGPGSQTISAQ